MSRRRFRSPVLAVVSLLAGSPTFAQSSTVTGVITDQRGEPLVGADVALIRPASKIEVGRDIADRDGRYVFRHVVGGDYALYVRFVGFAKERVPLTVETDPDYVVDIRMEKTNILMEPVVISASRRPEKALNAPSSVTVVTARELESDAVVTLPEALRNVVGVDIAHHGINHTYIAVRGFFDNYISRTLPLVDYRDMHGPGFSDAFYIFLPVETMDLDRIEVVRGPGSALYGPGVNQGVVHFITKNPFDYPGTTISVEAGERQIVRGTFRHAGRLSDRFGYKLTGRYFSGEDWHFDPDDPHDAEILDAIQDEVTDLNGNFVRKINGRIYDTYAWFGKAEAAYKLGDEATLVANVAFARVKNTFNASGEWQWDPAQEVAGQVRMTSDRLFAQAFMAGWVGGEAFNYRSGLLGHNKSTEFGVQVQHGVEVWNGRSDLTGGVDFQRSIPRTAATLMGRNEDHDDFYTTGAYLQSQTRVSPLVDLTLSARLDYFSPTEELLLSPRGALLFKLAPEHSVRLTYNRATGNVRGLAYFMDFIGGDNGTFATRFRGNADGFTFSDPLSTSSFVAIPGFPVRDEGVGIGLQRAYAAVTSGLVEPGAPLGDSQELADLLWSRMSQVGGFSQGLLILGREPAEGVKNQDPVKPMITNTLEAGYKGLLLNRVALGVDVYYTKRERFVNFQIISPFVIAPGLGSDLSQEVSNIFSDEELAEYGLSPEELVALYQEAGSTLGSGLIGIVEPVENFDPDTKPELLLINANFGELDYWGIDASAEAIIRDDITAFANVSWVSDNYFDSEELGEPGKGFIDAMNVPKTKFRLGLEYQPFDRFSLRGSTRYVQSFEVRDDEYAGTVDGYIILDLGAGYEFDSSLSGLRLDVTAQNALNNVHREYIGVPKVGRLVTARLTYSL